MAFFAALEASSATASVVVPFLIFSSRLPAVFSYRMGGITTVVSYGVGGASLLLLSSDRMGSVTLLLPPSILEPRFGIILHHQLLDPCLGHIGSG